MTSVKKGGRGVGIGGSRTVPKNLSVAGVGSVPVWFGVGWVVAGAVLAVAVLAAAAVPCCGVAGASPVRSGDYGEAVA